MRDEQTYANISITYCLCKDFFFQIWISLHNKRYHEDLHSSLSILLLHHSYYWLKIYFCKTNHFRFSTTSRVLSINNKSVFILSLNTCFGTMKLLCICSNSVGYLEGGSPALLVVHCSRVPHCTNTLWQC